jgi:hypothetical protein
VKLLRDKDRSITKARWMHRRIAFVCTFARHEVDVRPVYLGSLSGPATVYETEKALRTFASVLGRMCAGST